MENPAAVSRKNIASVLAFLGLLFIGTTQAAAAVVTFDTLPAGDHPVYSEAGFSLRSVLNDSSTPSDLVRTTTPFFALEPDNIAFPNVGFAVDDLILTNDASVPFSLYSLDLIENSDGPSPLRLVLTGTRADATTVSAMFTTDGIAGGETFFVPGFTSLVSLRLGGASTSDNVAIDNLVLASTVASVPEPNPILLLALGGLALVGPRWKRRVR